MYFVQSYKLAHAGGAFFMRHRGFAGQSPAYAVCTGPLSVVICRGLRQFWYTPDMPAKSAKQRRFFGAELSRKRKGKKTKTGLPTKKIKDFTRKRR